MHHLSAAADKSNFQRLDKGFRSIKAYIAIILGCTRTGPLLKQWQRFHSNLEKQSHLQCDRLPQTPACVAFCSCADQEFIRTSSERGAASLQLPRCNYSASAQTKRLHLMRCRNNLQGASCCPSHQRGKASAAPEGRPVDGGGGETHTFSHATDIRQLSTLQKKRKRPGLIAPDTPSICVCVCVCVKAGNLSPPQVRPRHSGDNLGLRQTSRSRK